MKEPKAVPFVVKQCENHKALTLHCINANIRSVALAAVRPYIEECPVGGTSKTPAKFPSSDLVVVAENYNTTEVLNFVKDKVAAIKP